MKERIVQYLGFTARMFTSLGAVALLSLVLQTVLQTGLAQAQPTQHERYYDNGDSYRGTMRDGMRHGRGRYEWAHGHVYEGGYENDLPHGQGVYTWPSGAQYEGAFEQGARHGQGRFTWGPGNYYEGEYRLGERTGIGLRVRQGETVYAGHFVDGVRQGEGSQVETSGDRFSGWYQEGVRHGFGVRLKADGSRLLERWQGGEIMDVWPLLANPRCALDVDGAAWMFLGDACIDGKAHGEGMAARLDGTLLQTQARAVLGRLIGGEIRMLFASDFIAQ